MLLSKAIGGSPTEPKYFWNIFEVRTKSVCPLLWETNTRHMQRGIDPHVDDPDHCHVRCFHLTIPLTSKLTSDIPFQEPLGSS